MNKHIADTERTLADVIRAGGLLPNEPARPVPHIADWNALVESARQHSVLGLLYSKLVQTGAIASAKVPKDVRVALRLAYARALAQNTRKLEILGEIAQALAARNVPVIALKGCALATALYDDVGQRHIGDIDFLVRREHIPAAVEVLEQQGFAPPVSIFTKDTRADQLGELVFSRPGHPPVSVEPHWHIFNVPYFVRHIPVNWFWSNSQPTQVVNQSLLMLNPDALVVHLCSHYVLHHVAQPHLRWSYDIALLLARHRDSINWLTVIAAARRFCLFGVVQQVLTYVMDLWDVTLTSEQHALVFGTKPTARERLLSRALTIKSTRPIIDGLMAGNLSRNFLYWRDMFFPPSDYVRARYGNEVHGPLVRFYIRRLGNGMRRMVGLRH